jgi:hypothetical protein
VVGVRSLRTNRPLGLGLLVGLLIVDGVPFILGLLLVIWVQMLGGLRNF